MKWTLILASLCLIYVVSSEHKEPCNVCKVTFLDDENEISVQNEDGEADPVYIKTGDDDPKSQDICFMNTNTGTCDHVPSKF